MNRLVLSDFKNGGPVELVIAFTIPKAWQGP